MIEFLLKEEYIELIKLLKLIRIASSGGEAKNIVDMGEVTVNGEIEFRKRAKLRSGDKINVFGKVIVIL